MMTNSLTDSQRACYLIHLLLDDNPWFFYAVRYWLAGRDVVLPGWAHHLLNLGLNKDYTLPFDAIRIPRTFSDEEVANWKQCESIMIERVEAEMAAAAAEAAKAEAAQPADAETDGAGATEQEAPFTGCSAAAHHHPMNGGARTSRGTGFNKEGKNAPRPSLSGSEEWDSGSWKEAELSDEGGRAQRRVATMRGGPTITRSRQAAEGGGRARTRVVTYQFGSHPGEGGRAQRRVATMRGGPTIT